MDLLKLAEAGPVAIVLVGIVGLAAAFIRGTVVPGYLYKQERAARLKAEAQVERLTRAAKTLPAVPPDGASDGT